uniref:Cystatin domain-containing protein n=2 Tax=Cyprinus carpio TaxID=7962 RepID=A0A8C0YB23_CYPCA
MQLLAVSTVFFVGFHETPLEMTRTPHCPPNQNCLEPPLNVANFAMDVHNRMSSYLYAFKVVNIISDTAQLYPPARVKYMLQIQAAQTVCENHASVNLTDCALQSNAEIMTCSFTIIAVPGNDYIPKHLLSDQCV